MKTLSTITMSDFISVMADGQNALLLEEGETQTPEAIAQAKMHLYEQFLCISDESGMKSALYRRETALKNKMRLLLFKICTNLIAIKAHEEVRDILAEYGQPKAKGMSDEQLEMEVHRLLCAQKREEDMERSEGSGASDDDPTPEDTRLMFEQQTAAMMSHFKFQMDTSRMSAAQYAHLVAQAYKEIKAINALHSKK